MLAFVLALTACEEYPPLLGGDCFGCHPNNGGASGTFPPQMDAGIPDGVQGGPTNDVMEFDANGTADAGRDAATPIGP